MASEVPLDDALSTMSKVESESDEIIPTVLSGGTTTDLGTNDVSTVASGVSSPVAGSGTATPVPVNLTKSQINKQRRNYFLEAQNNLNKRKVADSAKRFKYLIGLTDLFRHFIDARAKKDPEFKALLDELDAEELKNLNGPTNGADHRHRKTEKEEDEELLQDEESEPTTTMFTESPGYIEGTMRDYQIQGLNWMISLYENNISGILADEMGLGKTLQTISFLGYLRYFCGIAGPHIVIVPKSTLDNWRREFAKWTPEISTLVVQGDKETRGELINGRLLNCDFDVCITSYEMVLREKSQFKKFAWEYIVIDEAHRIKNEESMLSQIIRLFNSRNRLLLTGTPLQNNLHELWALLNFLMPDVFSDSEVFDEWFSGSKDSNVDDAAKQDAVVQQLHKVLRPFLLRRVKADVETSLQPKKEVNLYVGMSDMQYRWYQKILEKDIDAVNGAVGKREKTRLLNIVMQLRKCCNHPYLFEGAEPGPPYTTDEHLVFNCGKMIILDKLLKRMQEQGSRVLIFSQMSRMLDILEDYCLFRGYKYCRIDGQTAHEDRITAIDEYNKEGSEKFIFLLTTRAGGLGINLTTADIVVLYDSDWNPQADLQAMDRAHRIGQKKQVYVYRLVTENAVEEKVLERAAQKLRLDQLVIQQGRSQSNKETSQGDLVGMIQHGAEHVLTRSKMETSTGENGTSATAETGEALEASSRFDLDAVLNQGEERTQKLNSKFADLGIDDLQKFSSGDSAYQWNGQDFKQTGGAAGGKKGKKVVAPPKFWINPAKRERKENYSINNYYKDVMSSSKKSKEKHPSAPKPPKQIHTQDHQFYPQRLVDLQEKETAYFRKQQGYKVPAVESNASEDSDDYESREAERQLEQQEIDEAEPLTEAEEQEKKELALEGFSNWTRRDFTNFVHTCAKYGRNDFKAIANDFDGTKSVAEIQDYASVFWKRYTEIDGYDRYISQIEAGEERIRKTQHQQALLKKKVEMYKTPLVQLTFQGGVGTGKKLYTDEEDRFLTVQMYKFGLSSPALYEQIRDAIRDSPMFRFDWFILSRTPLELSRRCATILSAISKELEGSKQQSSNKRKSAGTPALSDTNEESSEFEVTSKKKKTSAKSGSRKK